MVERIISEFLDSNVFVVGDENSCVVIDAGAKTEDVEKVVGERKVEGVFLTHGHYDHCVYALEYAKKFGCMVYCSEFAKEYLADGQKNCSEAQFFIRDFSNFEFLSGSGKKTFENLEVEFKELGGHSKGDMIFKIGNNLFVGDLLIGRDIGRIDLFGGGKKQMIESLETLRTQDYDLMFSGHGVENKKHMQDQVCALWLKFLRR